MDFGFSSGAGSIISGTVSTSSGFVSSTGLVNSATSSSSISLSNQSPLFLSCAIQKNIQQIFDMAFSLQGFHEQRMPFVLRLLWCVLLLPCPEMMEVIGQHLVAPAFFLAVSLFLGRLSDMGLDSVLLPVVVADTEIVSQLHSGGFAGQSEQTGNKINCISVRLASETMETLVHLHAGISPYPSLLFFSSQIVIWFLATKKRHAHHRYGNELTLYFESIFFCKRKQMRDYCCVSSLICL